MSASFDYSGPAATVNRLLAKFGRTMTLQRASRVPDAGKPWLTQQGDAADAAAQSFSVVGVIVSPKIGHRKDSTEDRSSQRALLGTTVALPEEIGPDWEIVDGGRTFRVRSSVAVQPGDTLLIYRLELEA